MVVLQTREGRIHMFQDPNQGQIRSGQNPHSGYGPQQNLYEAPQGPYGIPSPFWRSTASL